MATFSDGGSQQSSTVTKLIVNEQSYSASSNSSVVAWELTMTVGGYNFSNWSVTSKVWLDDELIYNKSKQTSIGKNSTVTLASGTKTIYHNDNGKKTINCKAETSTSTSQSYLPGTATPSGTLKLTDIPRNARFDLTGWDTSERPVENEVVFKIIKPNDDFYCEIDIDSQQFQNLVKRTNIQDGNYTFQFTQDELNNIIYPFMANYQARTIVAKLKTYEDSTKETQIGEESGIWYRGSITNADPTFSIFSYEDSGGVTNDSNTLTYELTGNHNKIIPNYSKLKVTIPVENKAVGQKGATIDGYIIANKSVNYSSTADVVYEIEKYSNESITVSAVDSRGNSKSITKLFGDNLINYTDIAVMEQSLIRDTGTEEETTLSFSGDWWPANFGGVLNEITATYRYRIAGTSDWTTGTSTLVIDTSTFGKFSCEQNIVGDTANGFDIANSYEIEVTVQDKLSKKTLPFSLIAGKPAIAIYKNNIALGSQYDESKTEYPIQLNANTNISGNFTINGEPIQTNVTWDEITGRPTFAKVATSGSYNDLSSKPSIPSKLTIKNLRSSTSYNTTDTTLTNGANYEVFVLVGKVASSNSGFSTAVVVKNLIGEDGFSATISDEANFVRFTLTLSGNNILFKHSARSSNGYIQYIYGVTV